MLNWESIVQNYIIKYSNKIQKTTQPLREHYGIGYFTYHRIDYGGKYTVLVDRPDWSEHYVSEKIFSDDPYLRHPSVYQSGISLIENHGSDEYKELILNEGKKVLKMDLGAILIKKNEGGVEFFGFCGDSQTSSLQSLYLNHPQLLTSFADHFKKELGLILTKMEEEAGFLIDLKGNDFLCKQPICPDISSAKLLSYYRDLGLNGEVEKAEKLSFREKQCLKLLIQNKSAKETAVVLGLSRRTVEYYFENIKNKLACWTKQEVLQVAKTLKEMGLL